MKSALHAAAALLAASVFAPVSRAALPSDYKGKPYEDAAYKAGPQCIPGIVQAALYDLGGEGVAYHDTDAVNQGALLNSKPDHRRPHASAHEWDFRKEEAVDISYVKDFVDLNHPNPVTPPANLLYVGWTAQGEWCRYTVDVKQAGTYRVRVLYSNDPSSFAFSFNDGPKTTLRLPSATGYWHIWNFGDAGTVTIREAGLQVLTFHYDGGSNYAFFVFEKVD